MSQNLVDLEKKAIEFRNSGHLEEAAELFLAIVKFQPDWEHGTGFYDLAGCYEDLGRLDLAEECYAAALRFQPANRDFLGGLASFFYLHGAPEKAFDSYLSLLGLDRMNGDEKSIELSTIALKVLGKRMGLSDAEVAEKITRVLR